MSRVFKIAVVPGDGIGPEVTREAMKVLNHVAGSGGPSFEFKEYPFSADHFLSTGETLPDGTLEEWQDYDAIDMGAFGDPRVPDMRHAADILLGTRFRMDLYANIRPVRCLDDRLCPLEGRGAGDIFEKLGHDLDCRNPGGHPLGPQFRLAINLTRVHEGHELLFHNLFGAVLLIRVMPGLHDTSINIAGSAGEEF